MTESERQDIIPVHRLVIFRLHSTGVAITFLLMLTAPGVRSQTPIVPLDKIFDQFNGLAVWGSASPSAMHHSDFSTRRFLGSENVPVRYGFELLLGPYPAKQTSPIGDTLKALRNGLLQTVYRNGWLTTDELDGLHAQKDSLNHIEILLSQGKASKSELKSTCCSATSQLDLLLKCPLFEKDSVMSIYRQMNDSKQSDSLKIERALSSIRPLISRLDSVIRNEASMQREVMAKQDSIEKLEYASAFLTHKDDTPENRGWTAEGGLGVEFSDSYRDVTDRFDMRVPVRGYYLSVYLIPPPLCGGIYWYFGGTTGFYSINNGTLFQSDSAKHYAVSGNTMAAELVGGLSYKIANVNIYIELSYQYLAFDGLQFSDMKSLTLPSRLAPSRIDLSGCYFTIGFQGARKP